MAVATMIVVKATGFAGVDMENWEPNFRKWTNLHDRISQQALYLCRPGTPMHEVQDVVKALLSHLWGFGLWQQRTNHDHWNGQ